MDICIFNFLEFVKNSTFWDDPGILGDNFELKILIWAIRANLG